MKFMLKPVLGAIALTLASQVAIAAEAPAKKDAGKLTVTLKAMHVIDAKDNGYDPNSGQSELIKVKYVSPKINDIKLGMGFYMAGDFFNGTDLNSERIARGMFVTDDGSVESNLGELYLDYNNGKVNVYGGRMIFNSPLTTSAESTMPDFHTAVGASIKATDSLNLGVTQITQMSYGARAMTEFGLVGEGTGTAGTTQKASVIGQAEFHDIADITLGAANTESTSGITAINADFKASKNLMISVWDYYAHDISNNIYLEVNHTTPLKGNKLKLSGQYLTQSDIGDKLAGDLDFNMFGAKAAIGNKKWGGYVAMNQSSGETDMLNAWSGDPGYTSTMFSRNEYRENVTAYKLGGQYKISPKWILSGGYANYGQSDTLAPKKVLKIAPTGLAEAQTDATELDLAITWKPTKKTMLKLVHANRTSEYDGTDGADLTQAHTRLIGMVKF
ncbi:MAG: OprD family outer membrane porin [Pseudomonadota bacterium]|nr:OprD family outer membrane porin [Pseudomonadota bacterium]